MLDLDVTAFGPYTGLMKRYVSFLPFDAVCVRAVDLALSRGHVIIFCRANLSYFICYRIVGRHHG
jgi:hypothetical protein